jgi:hypothetical protein
MNYEVKSYLPSELSKDEIARCLALITEGGAVDSAFAEEQLPLAKVVAIVRFGAETVGVGAIKQRRPGYATGVAKKSGFSFDKNMLELGYVARDKSHPGHSLSESIVSQLLSAMLNDQLFATTSNKKMKATLKGAGFVRRGKEWPSKDKKPLSLWLRLPKSEPSSGPE